MADATSGVGAGAAGGSRDGAGSSKAIQKSTSARGSDLDASSKVIPSVQSTLALKLVVSSQPPVSFHMETNSLQGPWRQLDLFGAD